MATVYKVHPDTPQPRQIESIRDALRSGAVMLYPTDTVYAIGCDLNVKSAVERVRRIKQLSNEKPLTFLCSSLSNISEYALVSDSAYRLIRRLIPGTYTFLLPATKLVPRLVMSPKRKTTGIRVPDHAICQALLRALGNPIISTSAPSAMADPDLPLSAVELFDHFDPLVDLIIDDESPLGSQVSTILDLTSEAAVLVRKGLGWEAIADWIEEAKE
ncbi:threonylcarbamoyl-AMP synthase [Phormidium tenue FACHB-886]|nr:threonylcarbamoyl-AMP synthase [Phormidium tenue FACHB-886]